MHALQGSPALATGALLQVGDYFLGQSPPALFAVNASNGAVLNQVSLGLNNLAQGGVAVVDNLIYIGQGAFLHFPTFDSGVCHCLDVQIDCAHALSLRSQGTKCLRLWPAVHVVLCIMEKATASASV